MSHTTNGRRRLATTILLVLLVAGTATAATAHGDRPRWWQYDTSTWNTTWREDPGLVREHNQWHQQNQSASYHEDQNEHDSLQDRHFDIHFHEAISSQSGEASWYDADGEGGACGETLHGMYAASRTLPCGALVSVRRGDNYVIVRILDRGPYGDTSRILDLSPSAFRELAPLGAGVIDVQAVRLQP